MKNEKLGIRNEKVNTVPGFEFQVPEDLRLLYRIMNIEFRRNEE